MWSMIPSVLKKWTILNGTYECMLIFWAVHVYFSMILPV